MARRDAGVSDPRQERRTGRLLVGLVAGLLPILFLAAALALFVVPWLPNGIRSDGPARYEGLLHVSDEGVALMSFTTLELLRTNERIRAEGRQKSELICVDTLPELGRRIEAALKGVPSEHAGGRSLWVKVVAERRLGVWPCARRYGGGRHPNRIEALLRIVAIEEMRPLGCDSLIFQINHLRCPDTRPPKPVVLDDRDGQIYPEAARRARKEGSTVVRVLADSKGAVLSCEIARSSGDSDLDGGACELLRKRPDLVSKRGRTRGYAAGVREVTQRITWRLQPEPGES